MKLTVKQRAHVRGIVKEWSKRGTAKYEHGVKEHGGNLWEHGTLYLLDQAIDENIDQFVYLITLRQRLMREEHES